METDRAKYNCEITWKHKQPKPHQKPFRKQTGFFIEADLYEDTIKYFTACRDSLQVAAIPVLQTLYTA